MKTRFLTALIHESPGAAFQSAVEQNRVRRPLRIFATVDAPPHAARHSSPISEVAAATHARLEPYVWWRFSSAWRKKPVDNFISTEKRNRLFHSVTTGIAAVMLLLFAGCKSTNPVPFDGKVTSAAELKPASVKMLAMTNQLDPTLLSAPTNLFTLGPGDKLDVELLDETNSVTTTIVGPDGKIYFNLLPGLDVWGLTIGQTREVLQHELGRYLRGQPRVNISLREVQSKRVWLLGRVQQPGVYNMAAPTTLLEAIAAAGGSQSFAGQRQISEGGPLGADLADLRHSFLVRHGKMLPVDFHALLDQGDLSQNVYLQPDDFIYFAPAYAKEVYVLGAVTVPRPVQYVEGMTLLQAISGSYGTVRDAYLAHVAIIRGSLTQPQIAIVNYYDIVKGRVPDVPLEAGDIVYVPLAPYRYLRKYLDVALNTFVSSVAINAGTRLSTPANGIAGVTIPVGSGITIIPPPAPPIH